ncbi:HEAT repeat-containing protein 1, partial [Lunasporangiospora selenospora]
SLLALFDLVGQVIQAIPRDTIAVHYKQIFKFFLGAFDFRRLQRNTQSVANIAAVEDAVINAFMQLVMKLNETLFKPLFLKSLDWAVTELQVVKAAKEDCLDRLVFFYKLLDSLMDQLKSIITPYYGYVIDNVIEALTAFADTEATGANAVNELWPWVMSSLHKSFLYDGEGLWSVERFEKLMRPLVNQLMVTETTTDEAAPEWSSYEKRVSNWLVPCIGQIAVTLSNDALWKSLNYQVLIKTREEDKAIRLAALRVVQEFYRRLGEEFLILLPETIPFLAELMEDDDHEVEALTQQVIADIEGHLGGSLQKYFH